MYILEMLPCLFTYYRIVYFCLPGACEVYTHIHHICSFIWTDSYLLSRLVSCILRVSIYLLETDSTSSSLLYFVLWIIWSCHRSTCVFFLNAVYAYVRGSFSALKYVGTFVRVCHSVCSVFTPGFLDKMRYPRGCDFFSCLLLNETMRMEALIFQPLWFICYVCVCVCVFCDLVYEILR